MDDRSAAIRDRALRHDDSSNSPPFEHDLVDGFIRRWSAGPAQRLKERQGAQSHFLDLCRLLAIDLPVDDDNYCFERVMKCIGG